MRSVLALALLALTACQTGKLASAPAPAQPDASQAEIPALVETTCSSCHAIRRDELSPLTRAPSFVDIANSHGLTHDTLVAYLSDAHNYPDVMDVELDAADVEAIANYMLTLRSEDYRRMPS
ncbi:c-type cytochrome [Erythrobacter mangrovi]|nr:cytochrome c [Erythrobacter mangrovi]